MIHVGCLLLRHAALAALVGCLVLIGTVAAQTTDPSSSGGMRPLLSREQYEQLAKDLRQQYAQGRDKWPVAEVDAGVAFVELGAVPEMVHPEGNPFTKEKAKLGEQLYFDPRLSGSGQFACASCHDPDLGWADGRTVSFGHDRQPGKRNAPTVLNAGHLPVLFWDGRAASLEAQARDPILNPIEMHGIEQKVIDRLNAIPGYREQFKAVFGADEITLDDIAKAIATFERTIVSTGAARFDMFVNGNADALSDSAMRGLHLFRTDARCINCHHGPTFTDGLFHNLGLSNYGRPFEDLGRYEVTKKAEDVGKFRTPTLRNVTRTAPYMHHGLFELDAALRMYNAGGFNLRPRKDQENDPLFPREKSPLLKPLGLNEQDLDDLKAFLDSLSDSPRRVRPPELPGEE
jgi:cytochrome c peroxidase